MNSDQPPSPGKMPRSQNKPTPRPFVASEHETLAPPSDADAWATRMPRGRAAKADEAAPLVPPSAGTPKEYFPAPFGRYTLLKVLGKGGMGAVYLAHDSQLDRSVALKIPLFRPDDDPSVKERFFTEARSSATLFHANICPVHDVGVIDGYHYLTMAYVEGRTLADMLKAGKPQAPRQIAMFIRKLTLALEEAHRKKIIHRDLKPGNVMINKQSEPIIMDFGLARRGGASEAQTTQAGSVMGTPAYMAPEQARGKNDEVGPWSDVYSLGVILYEMLAGRVPFVGDVMSVLSQVLIDKPVPPSRIRPDVDLRLEAICLKAMAKKPADRYRSMAEFGNALADFLKGPSASSPEMVVEIPMSAVVPAAPIMAPPAPRPRPVHLEAPPEASGIPWWVWLLVGGGVATAVAAIIIIVVMTRPKSESPGSGPDTGFTKTDKIQSDGRRPDSTRNDTVRVDSTKIDPVKSETVRLDLNVPLTDAEIRVDGETIPRAAVINGIKVTPGEHRLEVSCFGYRTQSRLFQAPLADGGPLKVQLTALPGPYYWNTQDLAAGSIKGPDLSKVKPLFVDRFQAVSGFPVGKVPAVGADRGYSGGKYVIQLTRQGIHACDIPFPGPNGPDLADGFACSVVGQVVGINSRWGLVLADREHPELATHYVVVWESSKFTTGINLTSAGAPRTLELRAKQHSAIKLGAIANEVTMLVRNKQLEIYVNGIAICDPIFLNRDIRKPILALVVGGNPKGAVGTFDSVTFWSAESVPPLEQRGATRVKR